MSVAAAGGSGGKKGGGPPKKLPDAKQGGEDAGDPDNEDRAFCSVCNKYLRIGQSLAKHRKKSCVGPRDFHGDFACRFPGCGSHYRHYHDLMAHWRRVHPGAKKPKSMEDYVP